MTLASPHANSEPEETDPLSAQRRALAALYRTHYGNFVGLAWLTSGQKHSAEDIVQDAFVGAYRRTEPFQDLDSLSGYVARSVINGARSAAARRHPPDELVHGLAPRLVQSAETSAEVLRDHEIVLRALAKLPQRQRECAVCHFQFGLSHSETAAALGLRTGTVKTHLERARQKLVHELEEHK